MTATPLTIAVCGSQVKDTVRTRIRRRVAERSRRSYSRRVIEGLGPLLPSKRKKGGGGPAGGSPGGGGGSPKGVRHGELMARAALADRQAAEAYAKEARAWRAAVREEFFDTFTPGNKGSAEIDMVHFRFGLERLGIKMPRAQQERVYRAFDARSAGKLDVVRFSDVCMGLTHGSDASACAMRDGVVVAAQPSSPHSIKHSRGSGPSGSGGAAAPSGGFARDWDLDKCKSVLRRKLIAALSSRSGSQDLYRAFQVLRVEEMHHRHHAAAGGGGGHGGGHGGDGGGPEADPEAAEGGVGLEAFDKALKQLGLPFSTAQAVALFNEYARGRGALNFHAFVSGVIGGGSSQGWRRARDAPAASLALRNARQIRLREREARYVRYQDIQVQDTATV